MALFASSTSGAGRARDLPDKFYELQAQVQVS
jgi:hypothetical protein